MISDPARVHFPVRYYDQSNPEVINTLTALRQELLSNGSGGRLARHALRAVEEYIHAHLSEFHFARLFKQTTGLPPHQFVIHQRAKKLITAGQLSLVQIAVEVGFSDQSQLKRLVGVTPKQFD